MPFPFFLGLDTSKGVNWSLRFYARKHFISTSDLRIVLRHDEFNSTIHRDDAYATFLSQRTNVKSKTAKKEVNCFNYRLFLSNHFNIPFHKLFWWWKNRKIIDFKSVCAILEYCVKAWRIWLNNTSQLCVCFSFKLRKECERKLQIRK